MSETTRPVSTGDTESPGMVKRFHAACVGAAARKADVPEGEWYTSLDDIGRRFGVAPRLMVLHAVNLLPRITAAEIEEHPGLAVAHWLVLADLIPEAGPYRTNWIVRAEQMRLTAKMLRTDLQAGLAALAREKAQA